MRTLAVLLLGFWLDVRAEIYNFEGQQVPGARSLNTIYAFYIYSQKEAPRSDLGKPFIKFSGLALKPLPSADAAAYKSYDGVQVSIMRYEDFWKLIDTNKFCSGAEDVDAGAAQQADQLLLRLPPAGRSLEDMGVHVQTVRNSPGEEVRHNMERTGIYTLVFSNCGAQADATVSGAVLVKNAYGYLPGNEFPKMDFYGVLALLYLGLAATWLGLSFCWRKELLNIHKCITLVVFLGLLECLLWYLYFRDWNATGVRGKALFVTSTLLTVLKATCSYMLVLVAALGWGITRPYLDTQVLLKIQALSVMYVVLDFIREVVLSFRHSHSLSIVFVLLCLLPVSLLNGSIFAWIFTALPNLMETLKERRQYEKLALFQKLWWILLGAIGVATCTLLYQIFIFSSDMTKKWQQQWLFTDAISHAVFLFVLIAMMFLWVPHKYSQRFAYSTQVEGEELGGEVSVANHAGAIWADEEDGESFWQASNKGEPMASTEVPAPKKQARDVDVIGSTALSS